MNGRSHILQFRSIFLQFRSISMFFMVGVAGAVAYVILSSILTLTIGVPYDASILSYIILIPIVYLAQRAFSFQSSTPHRNAFPKYVVTQLIGLSISGVLPYWFRDAAVKMPIIVFGLVVIVVAMSNFILLRFWAFR
jgi:putative flippase GtrA